MNTIPDVVGYKLEEALSMLGAVDEEVVVVKTFGKKQLKSDEARIIRQKICNNKIQLIISYF